MGEPRRVQKQEGVQGIEKALALRVAASFCSSQGYSVQKLESKRLYLFDDEALFAAPSEVKPQGLMNDMATMPIPVLILKYVDGKITFETTEHTDKYLKD